MTVTGQHGGISEVVFDWVEEEACIECKPEPYDDGGWLTWTCEVCGGGSAKLEKGGEG